MATPQNRRSRTFVRPSSQLEVVLFILLIAWGSLLLNYLLFELYSGPLLRKFLPPAYEAIIQTHLFRILFCTIAISVPVSIAVGVHVTFRYFGPVHRFKIFLGEIVAGELGKECRIRTRDKLHDLCEAINRAVERVRADIRRDRIALRHAQDLLADIQVYLPEGEKERAETVAGEIREALSLHPALGPATPADEVPEPSKIAAPEAGGSQGS